MSFTREPHPTVIHFNEIKSHANAALKVARIMDVDYSIEQDEHMRAYLAQKLSMIRSVCDVLEARIK